MAKVLLVEDDNNLREIYEARLQAEGYTIVSANDGEAALVVAKNEKPDLIISDVMMPKISGFEMLDILRNTDGLKDVKVIMLTALGQADDQARANKLGADRYLVKSQVTLEDIVKVSHELLEGDAAPAAAPVVAGTEAVAPAPAAPEAPAASATPVPEPAAAPVAETPAPTIAVSAPPAEPAVPADPTPDPSAATPTVPEPPVSPAPAVSPPVPAVDSPVAQTSASEGEAVKQQIEDFVNNQPATPPPAADPVSETEMNDAAANDASLSEAVNNLVADTEAAGTPEPAAPEVSPEPSAPAPEAETSEPASEPESEPTQDGGVAHKKIIKPLDSAPQKSLDQLLAEEEATSILTNTDEQPSGAPTAAPSTQAETTGPEKPFDPNSISL